MRPIQSLLGVALLAFCLHASGAQGPPRPSPMPERLAVVRITPAGNDVPTGREIVFTFNREVVPIGRMDRDAETVPVRIQPPLACRWRWLDARSLACRLGEQDALVPSTRYTVEMQPGIAAEDGALINEPVAHTFVTERPRVRHVRLQQWRGPGWPVLQVVFNQAVTRESVTRRLFFEVLAEAPARMPVQVAAPSTHGRSVLLGEASSVERAESALESGEPSDRWLIAPVETLPEGIHAALHVEPGIEPGRGSEPSADERVVLALHTFPAPRFLGVRCVPVDGREIVLIAQDEPYEMQRRCDPLRAIGLAFSAPMPVRSIETGLRISPDLAGGRVDYDPWANRRHDVRAYGAHYAGHAYTVWLPERLKAFQPYALSGAAQDLPDAFGRPLEAPVKMRFMTAHRRPSFELIHPLSVLERDVDSELPLYVTNLKRVQTTFNLLTADGAATDLVRSVSVAEAEDIAFAMPLGVREMLGGRTGAVSGWIGSEPVAERRSRRAFFSQVTPFEVVVKLGHFDSLVWVTDMASGEPVEGAEVTVHTDRYASLEGPGDDTGAARVTDAHGLATLPGSDSLDPDLMRTNAWRWGDPRLFVHVRRGRDLAVVPLDRGFRVWPRTVATEPRKRFGHLRAWGTTAQGIYRAGDTIEFKIFVRHQDTRTLTRAPSDGYTLVVTDPKGQPLVDDRPVRLDAFGAFAGTVETAPAAAVGWYRFELSTAHGDERLHAFDVLVSDFTPSPFKVSAELNGDAFSPGDTLQVSTFARLHAGGPYARAATRVDARLVPRAFVSAHPKAQGFRFSGAERVPGPRPVLRTQGILDDEGRALAATTLQDSDVDFGELRIESAVRDERGKQIAAGARARYLGRDRFVGLRATRWLHDAGKPASVEYLVVSGDGDPQPRVPVAISVERQVTYAARVKGAGSAYQTRYERRYEPVASCEARSGLNHGVCEFTPAEAGIHRISARILDGAGRPQVARINVWVRGEGYVLWSAREDAQLAIEPEIARPAVGDTARYLVRNPYPGALALITVERYGVIERRVERLEGSTPVIAIEIGPHHLPGFYLSIVVMSPRVAAPPPERGQVDLGKPAMRFGVLEVTVDDPYKRLEVEVRTEHPRYKPRERVRAEIEVRTAQGARALEPIQLAVAVLDEAVLDLIQGAAERFDPYAGFYSLDPLDLTTYSLLTRLVGRQKFAKKGQSPGGDGGAGLALRSLIEFVSYWNPDLRADAQGRARLEFDLPDNLTGFRILVLAVTPTDRLGLGQGRIAVSRPTEIRPVMPNRLIEGDRFKAGFSVMNRTGITRALDVRIAASGATGPGRYTKRTLITLAPHGRDTVWLELEAREPGAIELRASARDASDGDRLAHRVAVARRRSLETAASWGSTESNRVETRVQVPHGAFTDVGGVELLLAPTVLGSLDGAFRYMRDYPYLCWEQRLSKGVMAAAHGRLAGYLADSGAWPDAPRVPQRTLDSAARFQAPNGGMSYWIPQDRHVSPYLSAYTALAFRWLADAGYVIPAAVERRLHAYLIELLARDVFPDFYDRGMSSTVRAASLAALARAGRLELDDLHRFERHVPWMSLFGQIQYLDAATRLGAPATLVRTVLEKVLARGTSSAGKFQLLEAVHDGHRQLLATPLRSNCAALSVLTPIAQDERYAEAIGDLPLRLVRTLTQTRGNRDHFENTQENVFCMQALVEYARVYEHTTPRLRMLASLDEAPLGEARFTSFRDPSAILALEMRPKDPGRTRTLRLNRQGTGRVYYSTRVRYALDRDRAERLDAGIEIRREHRVEREGRWQLLESPMRIRRGELVRVDLYLSLPAARHFVVVDDPVPGGLEPVNRDLATASGLDADKGAYQAAGGAGWVSHDDWVDYGASRWTFYHKELRHDSARFFSDYLPAGRYRLRYTAQAIAEGRFSVLPVHAEEMYDPDVFGTGLPATLEVTR